jgi:hypothetical protein
LLSVFTFLEVGIFFEEFHESINFSFTTEFDGGRFFTSGEQFNGRERFNGDLRNFIGGGVNLSDNDVFVALEHFGQFFIFGFQSFAMSAPGGIELNQNVFGVVHDNLFERFTDDNFDGGVIGGGDFFRFHEGLDFTFQNILNEFGDVFNSNLGFHSEFLNIFILEGDHDKSGLGGGFETQKFG